MGAITNSCDQTFFLNSVLSGEAGNTINNILPGNAGYPLVSTGGGTQPTFASLTVDGGGTGIVSASAYQLIAGGTTSTAPFQQVSGTGSAGEVLTSAGAGALPVWSAPSAAITWNTVSSSTQAIVAGNAYIISNGGLVTLTLPGSAAVGDTFQIVGRTGSWTIVPANGSQIMWVGPASSTASIGAVSSTLSGDCATFTCTVTNNEFRAYGVQGTLAVT